jgi:hypothetical protein
MAFAAAADRCLGIRCACSRRRRLHGYRCVDRALVAPAHIDVPYRSNHKRWRPTLNANYANPDRDTVRIFRARNSRTPLEFCHNRLRTNALLPRGFS